MLPAYHPEFEVWMIPHDIVEIVGGPLDGDLAGLPVGQSELNLLVLASGRTAHHTIDGCYAVFDYYADAKEPTS